MLTPFLRHWYAKGVIPLAVTLNTAFWPPVTVRFVGWAVIAGGVEFTVKVAFALTTLPNEFDTTTLNAAPLSPETVAGVV